MIDVAYKYSRPNGPYYHGLIVQPNCELCPLKYKKKVFPDGPVPAKVAIVGEGPGRIEQYKGRGFVGDSGQLLWMLIEQAGFSRDDVWVTNAALCMPERVKLTTGAYISRSKALVQSGQCCRGRLIEELRAVDPIVIIPVGNLAMWALSDMSNAKISDYRGSRTEVDLDLLSWKVQNNFVKAPIMVERGKKS